MVTPQRSVRLWLPQEHQLLTHDAQGSMHLGTGPACELHSLQQNTAGPSAQAVHCLQATGTCTQHGRPRALAERGPPDATAAPRAPNGPGLHACTSVSATAVAAGAKRKRGKPHLQGWRALPQSVHAALAWCRTCCMASEALSQVPAAVETQLC